MAVRWIPAFTAVAIVGLAAPSYAKCISATACLCSAPATVAEATIVAVEGPSATVRVDALHGERDPLAVGERRVVSTAEGDVVGRSLLLFVDGAEVSMVHRLESDGRFNCSLAEPDLLLTREEAIQFALRPDCEMALAHRGLQEPPCNDAVGGWSGTGCSAAASGHAAGLALLALFARRRTASARAALRRAGRSQSR